MPNFTTPRRFRYGRFFLFGLSLVLFSSGMELFGEKIVATWMALVYPQYLLLLPIYVTRAATRRRLSRFLYLRRELFRRDCRQPCHASGYRLRAVSDAADAAGWFGYPAMIAGCMMAPTAMGSIMAKSTVTQVLRWFGYRKTLVGVTVFIGLMIAQFSLQSPHAGLDADPAAVCAGDGDVHAVHLDEYHHAGRFDR
jgi:hypothetical protein